MTKWQTKLRGLDACGDAVEWAKDYKTFPAAWKACERGDWMFWLAGRLRIKRETLVLALVEGIRPVCLKHSKDPRVAECLDVCERWANGKATIEDVKQARAAAYAAAYAADAAAAYAADAATAYAAYAAAAATAYAAYAAAADAADAAAAAYAAARTATYKALADVAHKRLTRSVMAAWRKRG